MIQVPGHAMIIVLHDSVSFRNGIDGLSGIVRRIVEKDPMKGAYFVFRSMSGHSLRILYYDGGGYWLCTRRLSQGKFKWWPYNTNKTSSEILSRDLFVLIWGGNPKNCIFPDLWKKVRDDR